MPDRSVVLVPIPLARAPMRLLSGPLILESAGLVAVVAGVVSRGAPGAALAVAGVLVASLAVYLAMVLLTLRLDVEVATLRLSWLGGERRYVLSRGAVTRVALRGPSAAQLRPRFGAFGWAMGPAMLRQSEPIELVRLARTASVILVPTTRGRLAIAPLDETQLLSALGGAARIQQRLDEMAARAPVLPAPAPAAPAQQRNVEAAAEAPPRLLTGIERAILEERLAAERARALAAAEAERQAAQEAARLAMIQPPVELHAEASFVPRPRVRQRMTWSRPAWLQAPIISPQPVDLARSAERLGPFVAASLPLVAALVVWAAAAMLGRLDLPHAELRPVSLALAATGPLAALGALAARVWYPRLLGLVVVSALAGLLLVGRALLG